MTRQLNERFRLTASAEDGVLLDVTNGEYWQLNGLALTVLTRLADGEGFSRIVADAQAEYPDHADVIERDLRDIVEQFRSIGALPHE